LLHETKDAAQVFEHLDEAHECHVTVVDKWGMVSATCHEVATQEVELCLLVMLFESCDERAAMNVARSLTSYDKISHCVVLYFNLQSYIKNAYYENYFVMYEKLCNFASNLIGRF